MNQEKFWYYDIFGCMWEGSLYGQIRGVDIDRGLHYCSKILLGSFPRKTGVAHLLSLFASCGLQSPLWWLCIRSISETNLSPVLVSSINKQIRISYFPQPSTHFNFLYWPCFWPLIRIFLVITHFKSPHIS